MRTRWGVAGAFLAAGLLHGASMWHLKHVHHEAFKDYIDKVKMKKN